MELEEIFKPHSFIQQGSEAKLWTSTFYGRDAILKQRFVKHYRLKELDDQLTKDRIRAEARTLLRCKLLGICVPTVYFVDLDRKLIVTEYFKDSVTLRQYITELSVNSKSGGGEDDKLKGVLRLVGCAIAKLHKNGLIHGDLTTSNMLVTGNSQDERRIVLIDFGLSYTSDTAEDKAVDLYVLERAYSSTHPSTMDAYQEVLAGYSEEMPSKQKISVLKKLEEVQMRGRKRTMVG